MHYIPALLPRLIEAIADIIEKKAIEVTALDQAIGDGDHVINLQRGIQALMAQRNDLALLDWTTAWQKIGMIFMSTVGGASGSLFGTLFVAMSKATPHPVLDLPCFAELFTQGVESVKLRGKSDVGEKTLLDVLVPVAIYLQEAAASGVSLSEVLTGVDRVALAGMESTRGMLATKGRASFLEERSRNHIDAGAKTTQLMIAAIVGVLLATPA